MNGFLRESNNFLQKIGMAGHWRHLLTDWNAERIAARQRWMAKQAAAIWKID